MSTRKRSRLLTGPKELIPVPNISLGKYLLDNISSYGDTIAQVDAVTRQTATYASILSKSLSIAYELRLRGMGEGDTIAICSENNLEFFLPVLGALYVGVTVAPLNPSYTTRELHHSLSISRPSIVFCSTQTVDRVEEVARQVDFIRHVVVFGSSGFLDGFLRHSHVDLAALDGGKKRVAAVLCSSGTTGMPKGVMITDVNILTSFTHIRDPRYGNLEPENTCLGLLPYFHSYGFVAQLTMLAMGVKTIVMSRFEEELFLRSIQDFKITRLSLVPPLLVFLAKHPLVSQYDLSSLRDIGSGAAPLSEEVQNLVCRRLNIPHVRQGYGMTETTLGVLLTPLNRNKLGSSGVLAPSTQCKVIDLVTGKALGPNESGELCFKGPLMMKGYLGDSQATSATFDADGFLHTGDVGYYDEDEFFFIVDRIKELIKYKGFQVPPAELEAVLLMHPSIKDSAVIGIPDDRAGELPFGFVVLQPGHQVTEAEVLKFVAGQVSPQKRLHGVQFVDTIPKNPSGKILRRELRATFKSKL